MPGKFQDKNGANLSGHSDKWSDKNRRSTSHEAGAGRKSSRNQGTGLAGKANTMPSDAVDTSKMNPEQKQKYFNSLGLNPLAPPAEKPTENPVPGLVERLRQTFKDHPVLMRSIVTALQVIPKSSLPGIAANIIAALATYDSNDPQEVHDKIISLI